MDEEHPHTPRPSQAQDDPEHVEGRRGELARSVQEACSWIGASSSLSAPCSSSRHFISGHRTASGGSGRKSRSKRMRPDSDGRAIVESVDYWRRADLQVRRKRVGRHEGEPKGSHYLVTVTVTFSYVKSEPS